MHLIHKRNIKIICIIILTVLLLLSLQNFSLADGTIPTKDVSPTEDKQFFEIAGVILGTIQVIGTAVGVVVVAVVGIKYMIGSVEEKAEYKQTFVYYVIGAILLISAVNITNIIYNVFV